MEQSATSATAISSQVPRPTSIKILVICIARYTAAQYDHQTLLLKQACYTSLV